ncbi:S8 family serine peptidase [Litoribacillus peritrichatus]|uniref:PKD domain-containing protein n=1 Tax=Litoribacillus peritrichatus TaxID=718191 RepID=A0ABP7MV90_9GAMM
MLIHFFKIIGLFLLSTTLISCGGGGGGSGGGSDENSNNNNNNNPPTASFTVSSTTGEIPFTVNVDGSASTNASAYSWNFGNGSISTGVTSSHTYTSIGDYTITLTVTGSDGSTHNLSRDVSALGHTISGTITAPDTSVADSDTADINVSVPNGTFDQAQLLPNPATVGGYANSSNDTSDMYRAQLLNNQTISLTIANYQNANPTPNLDLYLYDENQNPVDSAVNATATDTLTINQDGVYFIEVRAEANAAIYSLNIGNAGANASSSNASVSSDFVIGEAIFVPKAAVSVNSASQSPNIGKLTMPASLNTASVKANTNTKPTLDAGKWAEAEQQKLDTLKWIAELNTSGEYQLVEPNYIRTKLFTPNDQHFSLQWHYQSIQLEEALDIETGDSNVIVAVVDTGVLLNHPDLQNQVISGYDFISDADAALDGDGIDNNPDDPGDKSNNDGSSSFHGSHVAGTVAATTNNSIGGAGVAGGVRLMPMRVLGENGLGTNYDIMQSLRYAAGLSNDSGTTPAQRADIINLSLGSPSSSQAEQDLFNQLEALGIIVIAAAGNSNTPSPEYPASYDNVISVSATNISNQRASYSNFGNTLDVAAPGGAISTDTNNDGFPDGVLSTAGDDSSGNIEFNYSFFEGTSMAAPHVAGVAALMKSANANIDADQFVALLQAGDLTDDIGTPGFDNQFGYGLINARKAVIAAGGANNAPASVVLSSNTINFGSFNTSSAITVSDSSEQTLTINSITSTESWASATANNVDGNNFGSYTINIDRTGLSDGNYSADITFDAGTTSSILNIQMQVATNPITADAGYIYILVIDPADPDNKVTVAFTGAASSNGQYTYEIQGIPSGDYQIVAGTDMNNDNLICDSGESCGAYPTLSQTSIISVNESHSGIDFTVSFDSQLTANNNSTTDPEFEGFQKTPNQKSSTVQAISPQLSQ